MNNLEKGSIDDNLSCVAAEHASCPEEMELGSASRDTHMTSLPASHDPKPPWSHDKIGDVNRNGESQNETAADSTVTSSVAEQHCVTSSVPESNTVSSSSHHDITASGTNENNDMTSVVHSKPDTVISSLNGDGQTSVTSTCNADNIMTSDDTHKGARTGVTSDDTATSSDIEDTDDISETSEAPDGGWGWVVVLGCALAFFLSGGLSRSFTLVYQQLLLVFDQSAAATSTTAAIFGAVKMCTSPLVSIMCSKFSKRAVAVSGGIITGTSLILTAFPVSLPYLYVTYGVMTAFGMNMVITPAFVVVGQYFRKRRARAMSLAMLGGSLGGITLPPLINFLFGYYGYSGTFIILGGLMFNLCVAGAVFRPLPSTKKAVPGSLEGIQELESAQTKQKNVVLNQQAEENDGVDRATRQTKRQVSFQVENDKVQIGLITLSQYELMQKGEKQPSKWHQFSKMVGLDMFRIPRFVFYSLLMMGSVMSLSISGTFLSGVVRDLGLDDTYTGILLSTAAIMDIPSKFASGFLFDLKKIRPYRSLFLGCLGFVTAGFVIGIGFSTTFTQLTIVYMLYTFFASAYHTQHATVLADLVGSRNLAGAMGMCRLFQGIGFTMGPTVGGHLKDKSGEYCTPYIFAAVVLLVFTLSYSIVDVHFLLKRKRKQHKSRHFPKGHIARYRHDSISTVT